MHRPTHHNHNQNQPHLVHLTSQRTLLPPSSPLSAHPIPCPAVLVRFREDDALKTTAQPTPTTAAAVGAGGRTQEGCRECGLCCVRVVWGGRVLVRKGVAPVWTPPDQKTCVRA